MARYRRKSRGTWLPTLPTLRTIGEDSFSLTWRQMALTLASSNDEPVAGVLPVLFDEPKEAGSGYAPDATPISDFVGNEYIVKRIVGQCFVGRTDNIGQDGLSQQAWPSIYVTAGFFVARAASDESASSDSVPLGWDSSNAWLNFSPQAADNIREPWMWRRSWILGSQGQRLPAEIGLPPANILVGSTSSFPANNVMYPNMSDHRVDIKSRRRVGNDERLWFICGAVPLVTTEGQTTTDVLVTLDVRAFGSLVKARNSGSF